MKKLKTCLLVFTAALLLLAGIFFHDRLISGWQDIWTLVQTTAVELVTGEKVPEDTASEEEPEREFKLDSETDGNMNSKDGDGINSSPSEGNFTEEGDSAEDAHGSSRPGGPGEDEGFIDISESPLDDSGLTLRVLDVGQALSILIECDGQYMLYDGGEADTSSYVVAYLKELGIKELAYVVASHYDSDHISGLIGVLNTFNVDRVIGPDYEDDTEVYDSFMAMLDKRGLGVEHPGVGERLSLGTADIMVLGPLKTYEAPNNNSIVLKISYGEDTFLLPGDAEGEAEKDMLSADLDLSADVLVLGHHGSRTSTSRDFLWAVLPDQVIVSCGRGNPYGMPEAGVLVLVKNVGAELFRTDRQGEIIAHTDGSGITWNVEPCNDFTQGDLDNISES